MKRFTLRIGGAVAFVTLAGIVIGLWWGRIPVEVDRTQPDSALTYLNADERMSGRVREGYVEYGGNTVHYVEAGSGEAVLFLHGFPSYWFSFARQIEALADDHRVIAIDGLGAGRSDAPLDEADYRLEEMAEHVFALLDELDVEQVHLVGHDWGAAFAFGLAQRFPERVSSVTGIGAPPQEVLVDALAQSPAIQERAAYIERLKSANPLLIVVTGGHRRVWTGAYQPLVEAGFMTAEEGALFRAATGDPRRLNAHINWYRSNVPKPDSIKAASYWPSKGARLTMPALLVWGSDDRVFDPLYAALFAKRGDSVRMLEIDGVGHWPHFERPDEVTDAIRETIEAASVESATK